MFYISSKIGIGMIFCTRDVQRGIQEVRSFLEPAEGFTSGHRIYLPGDRDSQRDLKTEIIDFANRVIQLGESIIRESKSNPLSQARISELHTDAELNRSKQFPEISGVEYPEYSAFCEAIEQLNSSCHAVTSPKVR